MLSTGAWNAMLKLLEEPPKTTIFIMATTDPQKIPKTILSRVQRYDFNKISYEGIVHRLLYIIQEEGGIEFQHEALEYIAKISEGGMRDAISMLDKCLSFNEHLTVENVVKALGISDYENLYKLLFFICVNHKQKVIEIIEEVYRSGKDLKQFIKQFISFILDVEKYLLYNNYDYIQIPNTIDLSEFKGANAEANYELILNILDNIIELQNQIKYETNPKILIESKLLLLCKGE
jgi:DNA polymerase-3 subunit gamma/tau